MRLIFALFQLPFWVFLAAAGGLFYLGEMSHRDTLAQNQEMARALAGSPPETVRLSEFSREHSVGLADEISVVGIINPLYNYELSKKRKGSTKTRYLFVLFDATDAEESKTARAALLLTEAERDKFINEYYVENSEIAYSEAGFVNVLKLNGRIDSSPDLSSVAADAFEEQNLKKADDFVYIEPFLEGRVAGLTPTVSADQMRSMIRGIAMLVAMVGLIKFGLRRRRKKREAAAEEAYADPDEAYASAQEAYADAPEYDYEPEPATPYAPTEEAPQKKRRLPLKTLAILGLAGYLLYSGYPAYAALAAIVALQIFAMRKTRNIITSGLGRLGLGAKKSDADVMANVQAEMTTPVPEPVAMTETPEPTRRRFGLPFLKGRKKAEEEAIDADDLPEPVALQRLAQPESASPAEEFDISLLDLSEDAAAELNEDGLPQPLPLRRTSESDDVPAHNFHDRTVHDAETDEGEDDFADVYDTAETVQQSFQPTELAAMQAEPEAEPEVATQKRGFGLRLPSLRRKRNMENDASELPAITVEEPSDEQISVGSKRRFGLPLPMVRRKQQDVIELAETPAPADVPSFAEPLPEKKKRSFSLPLPGLKRKPVEPGPAKQTAPVRARSKAAFQAETLFAQDQIEEKPGIGERMQLFMAHLTPAERTSKAFKGRPDPFEKLAAEVQRGSAH